MHADFTVDFVIVIKVPHQKIENSSIKLFAIDNICHMKIGSEHPMQ